MFGICRRKAQPSDATKMGVGRPDDKRLKSQRTAEHLSVMEQRSLPDLAVFALVAQHRSFRAAAQVLGVSASALSHTMRNLETRLDVRLLHRTGYKSSPVTEGAVFSARKPL